MSGGMAIWSLLGASLVLALAGAVVLLRHRWLRGWLIGSAGLALWGAAGVLVWAVLLLQPLPRAVDGQPLATVSIRAEGPQQYQLSVALPNGDVHDYALRGDLWQLDLQWLQWRSLLAWLGPAGYRLQEVSGRYLVLEQDRAQAEVHNPVANRWQPLQWLTHEQLFSARFLPLADGALFEVVRAGGVLQARPLNGAAEAAWRD